MRYDGTVTAPSTWLAVVLAGAPGRPPAPAAAAPDEPPLPRAEMGSKPTKAPAGYFLAPRHRGTGLLVTAGLLGAAALGLHTASFVIFRSTCGLAEDGAEQFDDTTDPMAEPRVREVVELGAFAVLCTVSIGPALTLRAITPLLLGGAVAVGAGGGEARGHALAFRDVYVRPRRRKVRARLGVGGALVALGGTLWLGSRIGLLRNRVGCDSIACLAAYDFATLQISAGFSIAGAAVLASTLAYRRDRARFDRLRTLEIVPIARRDAAGLGVAGRF